MLVGGAEERHRQHVDLWHVACREADGDIAHLNLVRGNGPHHIGCLVGEFTPGKDSNLQTAAGGGSNIFSKIPVELRWLVIRCKIGEEFPLDRRFLGAGRHSNCHQCQCNAPGDDATECFRVTFVH